MDDEAMVSQSRCGGFCRRGFFFPLVLIALGVIFLLDQLNYIDAGRVFAYFWPVVIIIFGLSVLSGRRGRNHILIGVVALAIGTAMLVDRLGYWNFDIGRFWPVILILIGITLLFRRHDRGDRLRHAHQRLGQIIAEQDAARDQAAGQAVDGEVFLDAVAVLGGYNRRITSQKFTGGRITAFFGGLQVDLTQADIAGPEAVVEVTAFLGGAECGCRGSGKLTCTGSRCWAALTMRRSSFRRRGPSGW